jgi:hypothetical protein
VPQAHRLAARIQERDWDDFTCDPTQLANGLRDLVDAVGPDGVAVSLPDVLLEGGPDVLGSEQLSAAVEATRRLKASMGERVALVACLPPPGALTGGADALLDVGKAFLAAGADALVVLGGDADGGGGALSTLSNVARFHSAPAFGSSTGLGLPRSSWCRWVRPVPVRGLALTDVHVPRETDVSTLEDWVDVVRG